ncbi:solute carrier family 35 member G1-like [Centruroides vittatus]|uniref:solute carrier family 35 member G1-like n=1 Tax=Centruroides sculpturatus TaxID=218467 RepID=UPI000C6CFABF|nr:solute carrier family 35 member G1-like [Centruroides sculpturatus]XP_023221417.1 solute carrier family 35 member G1-like [Centruroides sculpturatus]XP_023221418.1 solute carrier family 35 member G1-like [Centruroides sculpturatus]
MPWPFKKRETSLQEHPLMEIVSYPDEHDEDDRHLVETTVNEYDDNTADTTVLVKNSRNTNHSENYPKKRWIRCLKNWPLYQGLALSSASSIFFSLSSVIVKYLKDIHPGELACLRFVGILIFSLPIVIASKKEPFGPKNLRNLLIVRGFVGSTSLFLRFYALHYLPIADASVIIFSVPVFVSVLARIFLKELCGIFHVITVILTLIGIILITKLPLLIVNEISNYNVDHLWGVMAALLSTFFGASVYIVIRKVKGVHFAVIMFNFGWVAIIETTILTAVIGKFTLPKCGWEQWLIVALGIFSFLGQTCLTLALKSEQAGPVSVVRAAADIVLAFIWQIVFFDEVPDKYSISGALLVSSCVLLISLRKWILSLPEHSSFRKKAHFLTI